MNVRKRTRTTPPSSQTDEAAGYKKPPTRTQFKPGQSGNLNGRPRGSGGSAKYLRASLEKTVPVTVNGKATRMRRDMAFYEGLLRDALKGDNAARRMLLAEIRRLDEQAEVQAGTTPAAEGPADKEIVEKFRKEVIEDFLKDKQCQCARGRAHE